MYKLYEINVHSEHGLRLDGFRKKYRKCNNNSHLGEMTRMTDRNTGGQGQRERKGFLPLINSVILMPPSLTSKRVIAPETHLHLTLSLSLFPFLSPSACPLSSFSPMSHLPKNSRGYGTRRDKQPYTPHMKHNAFVARTRTGSEANQITFTLQNVVRHA